MGPARSRREDYSAESRQALLDSAVGLFADKGYAATSLDEIAEAARLTKGALYWHFGSKQALFRAVIELLEQRLMERVTRSAGTAADPWQAAETAMVDFLDACCDPTYARIVLREGQVVLGFDQWHEVMEQYSYGLTRRLLASLVEQGLVDPLPIDAWSRVVLGQLSAAAMLVAEASEAERPQVRQDAETVLRRILEGFRSEAAR
jgi:AcrR family transcriptional regulator